MRILTLLILGLFLLTTGCDDDLPELQDSALLSAQRWVEPGIYDSKGRFMLMRGVNLNTLGDYWQANVDVPATGAYEPDHFGIMASYGFNVVRLLFNWSALEPVRGQYDQDYIAQIRQAVEDAASHGIYVLLDMHQDAYSKYIATPSDVVCETPAKGWDGAPEWATLTNGQSTCTNGGARESAPAAFHSWGNFWNNTDGLRDACMAAWQEVVRATASNEFVLGYDAINEPALGNGDLSDQLSKYNAYLKSLVRAIREAEKDAGGLEHIFFFETTVGWNGEQIPSVPAFNFTMDQNIVFAPHNYFEVIGPPILTLEEGAALYNGLANSYGTHCLIGEWGVFGNPVNNLPKLKRFADAEDDYFMSSTWWQWCQAPGDPHGINWSGDQYSSTSLHLLEMDVAGAYTGVRNDIVLNVLGRARPLRVKGKPLLLESDSETGRMLLTAEAQDTGETVLWIPNRFGMPAITGSNLGAVRFETVEGGYYVTVQVSGNYEIEVAY